MGGYYRSKISLYDNIAQNICVALLGGNFSMTLMLNK